MFNSMQNIVKGKYPHMCVEEDIQNNLRICGAI